MMNIAYANEIHIFVNKYFNKIKNTDPIEKISNFHVHQFIEYVAVMKEICLKR